MIAIRLLRSLHAPGLVYIAVTILIGLAAMNNQNNLLFWIFGVMIAGIVISWMLVSLSLRSIRIRRIDPRQGEVGEPLMVRYAVTNRSRWMPVFNIHIDESHTTNASNWRTFMNPAGAWAMHIGPGDTVHGEAVFWPRRRGKVTFHSIRAYSTFPFGIIRKSITVSQSQHTYIYPLLYQLRRDVLGAISPVALMGSKVTQHAGAGDDYYGMREYRMGDSLRHISWRRTAQLDQLITVERTSPSPARLRVILDLRTPTNELHVDESDSDARHLEEQAISLAASIFHAADLAGYEIGLTILGIDAPTIAVRRNVWHRRKIMAALAGIDLNTRRMSGDSPVIHESERSGLIIISPDQVTPFTDRSDAWYLTARQLKTLAIRPIGWEPAERAASGDRSRDAEVEAA